MGSINQAIIVTGSKLLIDPEYNATPMDAVYCHPLLRSCGGKRKMCHQNLSSIKRNQATTDLPGGAQPPPPEAPRHTMFDFRQSNECRRNEMGESIVQVR